MSEEPTLSGERWVRVMADYCADGVWDHEGVAASADDLPIPADLVARIRRWQDWYETSDLDARFDPAFDLDGFTAEGFALARAVKAALPGWTVIAFDEAAAHRWPPFTERPSFHVEITLPEAPPVP